MSETVKKICLTQDCGKPAITKAGLCRSCNMKQAAKAPRKAKPPVEAKDPHDKKLEHFMYRSSEHESQVWEHGDENPLNSPIVKAIKNKYPDMHVRFVTEKNLATQRNGFQKFTDGEYKDGVRVGELWMAMIPKSKQEQYAAYVAEKSSSLIRSRQDAAAEAQVGQNLTEDELKELGASGGVPGISVGKRPVTRTQFGGKTVTGGGYQRGAAPDRAYIRRQMEDRKKNRVYSFSKG